MLAVGLIFDLSTTKYVIFVREVRRNFFRLNARRLLFIWFPYLSYGIFVFLVQCLNHPLDRSLNQSLPDFICLVSFKQIPTRAIAKKWKHWENTSSETLKLQCEMLCKLSVFCYNFCFNFCFNFRFTFCFTSLWIISVLNMDFETFSPSPSNPTPTTTNPTHEQDINVRLGRVFISLRGW